MKHEKKNYQKFNEMKPEKKPNKTRKLSVLILYETFFKVISTSYLVAISIF